jgi:hypothetical protein
MNYVYIPAKNGEPATVGYYDPKGDWHPESDHDTDELAAARVRFLNGVILSESAPKAKAKHISGPGGDSEEE